jgi:hypothetical protein
MKAGSCPVLKRQGAVNNVVISIQKRAKAVSLFAGTLHQPRDTGDTSEIEECV